MENIIKISECLSTINFSNDFVGKSIENCNDCDWGE